MNYNVIDNVDLFGETNFYNFTSSANTSDNDRERHRQSPNAHRVSNSLIFNSSHLINKKRKSLKKTSQKHFDRIDYKNRKDNKDIPKLSINSDRMVNLSSTNPTQLNRLSHQHWNSLLTIKSDPLEYQTGVRANYRQSLNRISDKSEHLTRKSKLKERHDIEEDFMSNSGGFGSNSRSLQSPLDFRQVVKKRMTKIKSVVQTVTNKLPKFKDKSNETVKRQSKRYKMNEFENKFDALLEPKIFTRHVYQETKSLNDIPELESIVLPPNSYSDSVFNWSDLLERLQNQKKSNSKKKNN